MTSTAQRGSLKFLVIVLIATFTNNLAGAALLERRARAVVQTAAWQDIQGLPPGTRLKLVFADGTDVTGTVVETRADAVLMNDNRPGRRGINAPKNVSLRDAMTFHASDVVTASILKMARTYKTTGSPDAVAVRHAATELGVGRKVDLKTTSSTRFRGKIRSIDQDRLTVVHGFRSEIDSIPFGEVSQLKPAGLHWAAKTGIAVGAVYGAVGLIVLHCVRTGCYGA